MLTVLSIHPPKKKNRLFDLFMPNTISVSIKETQGVSVKLVECVQRKSKLNWNKLDKIIGAQRNHLLCSQQLQLPKELSYKRFHNAEYKQRLCINLAIALLSSLSMRKLRVALVDADARYGIVLKYLLKYTDSLLVVTEETKIYRQICDNLLEEMGAPVSISKNEKIVSGCDLVIAPSGFTEVVDCKEGALVLTVDKPQFPSDGIVVYDYGIKLQKEFRDICPEKLDETYFASALYTVGGLYKLGSIVPQFCVCEGKIHTLSSLKSIMKKVEDKNLT